MAKRYYETVIGNLSTGYLQAFDLTGAIARDNLARYKRSDMGAIAADWRRVGRALQVAMNRSNKKTTHESGTAPTARD